MRMRAEVWAMAWALCASVMPSTGAVVLLETYDGAHAGVGTRTVEMAWYDDPVEPGYVGQRVAVPIVIGGSNWQVETVVVHIALTSGNGDNLRLKVYSDQSATRPGSVVATLGNPAAVGSASDYGFAGGGLTLAANTRYWLVAEPAYATLASFAWSAGAATGYAQLGSKVDSVNYFQGTWKNSWLADATFTPALRVEGSAVPEPLAHSTVVALLLMLCLVTRRLCPFRRAL